MRQIWMSLTLIAVIAIGVWALANRSKIETVEDALSLAQEQIGEVIELPDFSLSDADQNDVFSGNPRIRLATLHFGKIQTLDDPETAGLLLETIQHFDLLAIQDIQCESRVIRDLLDRLAKKGRHYEMVLSPRVGGMNSTRQFGFLFDAQKIQLDGSQRYLVNDPDKLFQQPPFVGWFRVQTADPSKAFTFTMVNVQLDPQNHPAEIQHIAEVFRAVRADGRGEDDVILAGDFQCGQNHLPNLSRISGLVPVTQGVYTDLVSTRELDNIVLNPTASIEFTGQSGVLDLMQRFNLTRASVLKVSERLPVWAEFMIHEGSTVDRFAETPESTEQQK